MGLTLRKTLSLGFLRFTLSGSGIGASIGVRGMRLGAGPRGTYVSVGAGGVNYRKTLGAPTSSSPGSVRGDAVADGEISSRTVLGMEDATSGDLLGQLNAGLRARNWLGSLFVAGAVGCVSVLLLMSVAVIPVLALDSGSSLAAIAPAGTAIALGGASVAFGVLAWIAGRRHKTRATTILMFDLDGAAEDRIADIYAGLETLASCARVWHVVSQSASGDRKRNAGAGTLVSRTPIQIRRGQPPSMRTNLDVPCVPAGRELLFFMPDRLLVFDSVARRYGAVSYEDVEVEVGNTRFVEDGSTPHDADVVDSTWAKVNRDGTPDRRFNNNRRLAVCRYGELVLSSRSGLREMFQFSRPDGANTFARALTAFGGATSGADAPVRGVRVPATLTVNPSDARVRIIAFANLLRYVAAGDRKFTESERTSIERALVQEFSSEVWLAPVVGAIVDECKGDSDVLAPCLAVFRDDDEASRGRLASYAEALALADGKATPAELKRLAALRSGLLLS